MVIKTGATVGRPDEPGMNQDMLNPFNAGTVFRRQNVTSIDVRFWRLKSIPALKE